jgi:acyl-CoA thioesterase-2
MPAVPEPDAGQPHGFGRLFSFEGRTVPQPYENLEWPTRFWARCTDNLKGDPLLNACALTYVSDVSTGLLPFNTATHASSASLDHAVWFHRAIDAEDWMLLDLAPHSASGGRGWYTGSVFARDGRLIASYAQESLFRRRRDRTT